MGQMQNNLTEMLISTGWKVATGKYNRLTTEDIKEQGFYDEVQRIYTALGGKQDMFPIRFGKWDIELDEVVVELDEQRHFNRYRLLTLESEVYLQLHIFPHQLYREYCKHHEEECLKAGGYGGNWTNPSCERNFGKASAPKDLTGNGAPRWKQRAFYDYLKDISIITNHIPLVRISIWDSIVVEGRSKSVIDVLKKKDNKGAQALKALVQQRIPC